MKRSTAWLHVVHGGRDDAGRPNRQRPGPHRPRTCDRAASTCQAASPRQRAVARRRGRAGPEHGPGVSRRPRPAPHHDRQSAPERPPQRGALGPIGAASGRQPAVHPDRQWRHRGPRPGAGKRGPERSRLVAALQLAAPARDGRRWPLPDGALAAPAWHARIAAGETVHLHNPGAHARLSRVADFEDIAEPRRDVPANIRISNPFNMSGNATQVDVADASRNLLWRVSLSDGGVSVVTRFASVPNPTPAGPPSMDAVPASVRGFGNDLLVSYLTGAPFARRGQRADRRSADGRAPTAHPRPANSY